MMLWTSCISAHFKVGKLQQTTQCSPERMLVPKLHSRQVLYPPAQFSKRYGKYACVVGGTCRLKKRHRGPPRLAEPHPVTFNDAHPGTREMAQPRLQPLLPPPPRSIAVSTPIKKRPHRETPRPQQCTPPHSPKPPSPPSPTSTQSTSTGSKLPPSLAPVRASDMTATNTTPRSRSSQLTRVSSSARLPSRNMQNLTPT